MSKHRGIEWKPPTAEEIAKNRLGLIPNNYPTEQEIQEAMHKLKMEAQAQAFGINCSELNKVKGK